MFTVFNLVYRREDGLVEIKICNSFALKEWKVLHSHYDRNILIKFYNFISEGVYFESANGKVLLYVPEKVLINRSRELNQKLIICNFLNSILESAGFILNVNQHNPLDGLC